MTVSSWATLPDRFTPKRTPLRWELQRRTIKHEEVYLRAYDSVSEARSSIGRYLAFYNAARPHSGLDGQTPDEAYFNQLQPIPAAA